VSVVATLLKQVPASAKFKPKLEALEKELMQLRAENARLQVELAQYIEQWETLDGPQVSALQYLARYERGHAAEIARAITVNIQIAETSLVFLHKCDYVTPATNGQKPARGKKAQFALSAKGARYLRDRGLYK
jgi:hypothetical protein